MGCFGLSNFCVSWTSCYLGLVWVQLCFLFDVGLGWFTGIIYLAFVLVV